VNAGARRRSERILKGVGTSLACVCDRSRAMSFVQLESVITPLTVIMLKSRSVWSTNPLTRICSFNLLIGQSGSRLALLNILQIRLNPHNWFIAFFVTCVRLRNL
jgi:hypothetical protein